MASFGTVMVVLLILATIAGVVVALCVPGIARRYDQRQHIDVEREMATWRVEAIGRQAREEMRRTAERERRR